MAVIARNVYEPYVLPDNAEERSLAGDGIDFIGDPGVTKQADSPAADINNILRRYEVTGALPDMIVREPRYGDFSDAVDYQESLNIVMFADEQFAALDARVRTRFDNSPAKFLEFMANEDNLEEIVKMGLANDAARARLAEKHAAEAVAAAFPRP